MFVRETEAEIEADGHALALGRAVRVAGRAGNLVGTPEQVAEKIQAYIDLGVHGLRARGAPTTPTPRRCGCFAEKVMPEFR